MSSENAKQADNETGLYSMPPKNRLVKIGDFFFKWRNYVFPLMLLVMFVLRPPPSEYMGMEWVEEYKDVLAGAFIAVGLLLRSATIGWAYIKRGGLNKQVYANDLVISGYFGMSRNPLYLGNMIIYMGVFAFHGDPIIFVMGSALFWFIYEAIIAAEEYFLRQKFGPAYDAYCQDVPRWFLRLSNYKKSVAGMDFKWTRSIAKDYSTIFNTFLAIAVIEGLEHYAAYSFGEFWAQTQAWIMAVLMLLSAVFVVKYLKKNGHI